MTTRLITYHDESMSIAANICVESAERNNVDFAYMYNESDIDNEFKEKNKHVLSQKRGAGYWLWKPYLINKFLTEDTDGDILIYCDAGVEIINDVRWIVDRMNHDIFLFGNMFQHDHWCKMDVIKAIAPTIKFDKQVQASVIFIRNSEWSREFVKRWLTYCQKPGYIDDSKSTTTNHPEFREHRHDQAVLTCLAYKMQLPLHWWPAIYNGGAFTYDSGGYRKDYPPLFHHHRMRNDEFKAFGNGLIMRDGGINHRLNVYMRRKNYKIFQ